MKKMLRVTALVLALLLLAGCGETADAGPATKLSFQATAGYDYLKTLDGQRVSIDGYVATSSPVDGSFIFLMNLPYQSCPFCVPNTSQLSNTIEVYPKKGSSFDYTAQAVRVTGTLAVAESEDQPFTDQYGYQFNFKIVNADYQVIRAEELSAELALWQKLAQSDVVNEIYAMYDYVNFLCRWNTYYVNSGMDEKGNRIPGYFLYPEDAQYLIKTEGQQYHYGYQEGYFDRIVEKINGVDPVAFQDLAENVRAAQALAEKALAELENKNYTREKKYLEQFGTEDYVYTLTNGEQLQAEMDELYYGFSAWLGSWEL